MGNISFIFDLTITQGDDRPLEFVFWTDEDRTDPLDISAWELWYTAKVDETVLDVDASIALDPDDFTLTTSEGSGAVVNKATANIPATATAAMAVGTYIHDLQRKLSGKITTLGTGKLVIEKQATQRTT